MANRLLIIMVALAIVAGAGAIFMLRGEGQSSSNASALGQPLFPQLKVAEVARITITDAQGALNLEKKGESWTIAERGGFPADIERVSELVVGALQLKTGQSEPIAEKERARMQLGVPGKGEGAATVVTFKAQDGKTLAELLVGKKYFKTQPEGDVSRAQGDGRFVMLPADATRVIVVTDPLKQVTTSASEWVSREGVAMDNIKSLDVQAGGGGYKLTRASADAAWVLDGKGGELDPSRANAVGFSLAKLELADVAAPGVDAGLGEGGEIAVTTFDGLAYRIKLGKLDRDRYFAQVTLEGTPTRPVAAAPPAPPGEKPEDKAKREKAPAEEAKKFTDRVAREKALAPFTVLIAKSKFETVLKKRDELLKKEEPKDAKSGDQAGDKRGAKK